jgi:hypothetical protein
VENRVAKVLNIENTNMEYSIQLKEIQNQIFTIRGVQVMVDRDLAEMYKVKVKALNQAVKRNTERFPKTFYFQLSDIETNELVTNCDRFNLLKHSSVNPYVFTEQGVSMLSAVLKSDTAVQVSIAIINAFVEMRKLISYNASVFQRLDNLFYHFGASLKDLGKKWFAFSKMDKDSVTIINEINRLGVQ